MNNEDQDVANSSGFTLLATNKIIFRENNKYYLESKTCDPSIYTMDQTRKENRKDWTDLKVIFVLSVTACIIALLRLFTLNTHPHYKIYT